MKSREIGALTSRQRDRLRVAVVAPPWYSVPLRAYGGTEAVCAGLVDGLAALGHDVVLIGAGEDLTSATFHPTFASAPSDQLGEPLPEVLHAAATARILADMSVDLVHDHSLAGPLSARGRSVPTVVTSHGTVTGEPGRYYRELGDTVRLVAISDAQRLLAPELPWAATIYNGVDVASYPFQDTKSDYVLFLGRSAPRRVRIWPSTRLERPADGSSWPASVTRPSLGRAVRHGDDRGACVRHAGGCAAARVRSGDHHRRRQRIRVRRAGGAPGRNEPGGQARSGGLPGGRRALVLDRHDGPTV